MEVLQFFVIKRERIPEIAAVRTISMAVSTEHHTVLQGVSTTVGATHDMMGFVSAIQFITAHSAALFLTMVCLRFNIVVEAHFSPFGR